MLHDLSFHNLVISVLGSTIETLINFSNLLLFQNSNLNLKNFMNYIEMLNLWFTDEEKLSIQEDVFFALFFNKSYFQVLKEIYTICPSIYAFDYLHYFYLKQIMYKAYLSMYASSLLVSSKFVCLNINLEIFSYFIFTKWFYGFSLFFLCYFITHIMKFRFQYGFNFYFNYFKILSDLGEQEYGSYDDFKFFLFILIQMLVWYCWVFFIGYTTLIQSDSKLILLTLSIIVTILLIPVRLLWDFGLAFSMFVRGAASSSNLIVESFFDLIGVIIIFTRFIVQNIRFLMVFVALFELFEWTFSSNDLTYILQFNINLYNSANYFSSLSPSSIFLFIIFSIKIGIMYIYHLMHLVIVSFMQIGVFLMVSFWLFFFLYTSFFKISSDNYFFSKRI